MPPASKTTSKKKQAADDAEDKQDQAKDETAEDENGNMTDQQKREKAFRDMIAKRRGKLCQQVKGISSSILIPRTRDTGSIISGSR